MLEISVILAPQGARKKSVSGSRPSVVLTQKNQYFEADIERYIKLYGRLPFAKIASGVLGQIGCSSISGLWCRRIFPAGPDGIR